jgi:hypothetical protein
VPTATGEVFQVENPPAEAEPPGPVCAECSKPIRLAHAVVYEQGESFHVGCLSRITLRRSLEVSDRAKTAQRRARLVRTQAVARSLRATPGTCPVCGERAMLTDWRPRLNWVVIENCPCQGFFVQGDLFEARLSHLTEIEREQLAHRIGAFRAMGHHVWITTLRGTVTGPLVVRTERPDRPTEPATQTD